MFCSNCGSQIPDGSAFCPNCGTRSNAHEVAANAGNINQTVVTKNFIVSTLEAIPGKEVEILGIAKGSIVSSRNVGKDILSGFKNMAGGEIAGYTELAESAYSTALDRMKSQAMSMGADAIIGVRFVSATVTVQGAIEATVYGTAVKTNDKRIVDNNQIEDK